MHQTSTMASSAQTAPSSISPPSPPPRPKRANLFKRSSGSFGAVSSGIGFIARITGTSASVKNKVSEADSTSTANVPDSVSKGAESESQQPGLLSAAAANGPEPRSSSSDLPDENASSQTTDDFHRLAQPTLTSPTCSSPSPLLLHRSSSEATSTSSARASPSLSLSQALTQVPSHGSHSNFSRPIASPTSYAAQDSDILEQQSEGEGIVAESPSRTPILTSRESSVSEQGAAAIDDHMVAQAAQMVLEAARRQAQVETRKKGKSAPASPKALGRSLSPIDPNYAIPKDSRIAQIPDLTRSSSRSRSKSDAGSGDKAKARKSFFRTFTSRSGRAREGSASSTGDTTGSATPTAEKTVSPNAQSQVGAVTPGAHKRRFVDTRDIDLLIRELAAEAIAEQVPQPPFARASRSGSSSPLRSKGANGSFNDPRRGSFPSILEDAPMQLSDLQSMSPHSAADHETFESGDWDVEGSKTPASSLPASPRLPSDDPAMSTVPLEMFTGLGGSPYPALAQATTPTTAFMIDTADPYAFGQDSRSSDAHHNNVYQNQAATARNRSTQSFGSQTKVRRPVLTMTMNDPEAELQGLTRPPKGSKKSTPFASRAGSRAGSRGVSPRSSFSNLKQEAEKLKMSAEGDQTLERLAASQAETRQASLPSAETSQSSPILDRSNTVTRISAIFRPSKTKSQDNASGATLAPASPSTVSPPSTYNSPLSELQALSPESNAVSTHSDNDVSPAAFRQVDLPLTVNGADVDDHQNFSAKSARPSLDSSRRSISTGDKDGDGEQTSGGKKGIRKLLRRLSSFGSAEKSVDETRNNGARVNFPDNSTMPAIDHEMLKKLNVHREQDQQKDVQETSDLSVNTEGSKGHRSDEAPAALASDQDLLAFNKEEVSGNAGPPRSTLAVHKTCTEGEGNRTSQDRRPSPHLVRTTSRTPSSEDSIFQSSDNSYSSGRESGGLFKRGSESAMSEELNTPEVSSGYLPDSKEADAIMAQQGSVTGERTPLARDS